MTTTEQRAWATGSEDGLRLRFLAAVVVGAALLGLFVGSTTTQLAVTVSLGLVAVGGFAYLAGFRFEGLVLAFLVLRSALDIQTGGAGGESEGGISKLSALVAGAFLVVTLLWLLMHAVGRQRLPLGPSYLRLPALAVVAAGFASVIASTAPLTSAVEALRVTAAIGMLLVLELLMRQEGMMQRVLVAVYASAVLPLVVALVQAATGGGAEIGGFRRVTGTFDHPNPLAIYLTFLVVMGAGLYRWVDTEWRLPLAVVLVVAWGVLLLTYTRSAWIAAVIGILVVGVLQSRRLIYAVGAGIVAILLLVPSTVARFSDLGSTQYTGAAGDSLTWRFEYWLDLIPLVERSPLTGIGLKVIQLKTTDGKNAHDDFLRSFVEMGLFGLLAYVALLVALAWTARQALRATQTGLERGVAVGFAGTCTAFLVLSTVSNIVSQTVLLWYFFAFAAAAMTVAARGREHRPESAPVAAQV